MDQILGLRAISNLLTDYIAACLPWLGTRPALVALLIAFGPVLLIALGECWLSRRTKKNRVLRWDDAS